MKAIMISIRPQYVADILNGKKTLEIRKTLPKCELPIEVYIYVTKGCKKDWHLIEVVDTDTGWKGYEYDYYIGSKGYLKHCLEGKVVAKFTLNTVEEIAYDFADGYEMFQTSNLDCDNLNGKSCLKDHELKKYLKPKREHGITCGYAWRIDNLVVFDKPKEISEFRSANKYEAFINTIKVYRVYKPLTRAPQNYCFVEV